MFTEDKLISQLVLCKIIGRHDLQTVDQIHASGISWRAPEGFTADVPIALKILIYVFVDAFSVLTTELHSQWA